MRILVTGGAGFLGSHLVDRLLSAGHYVISLDNYYTGSKENLSAHSKNNRLEELRWDVTNPIQLEVDAIYNLACPASPDRYQKYPVQTIKTSILGAINMLDLARSLEVPILQASTSEIYGDPVVSPQPESYWGNVNPIGIRSCYDEGKRAAESLFFDYRRQYGVDIRVARIFNTYGPRMDLLDGRVVSNFIYQALLKQPITIYGNGSQTRSFCYVDDLISGLVLLMESETDEPINLGNSSEYSILDLASEIISLTNSNSKIEFRDLPDDDPRQRRPELIKAREKLGWEASVDVKSGLAKTIADFRTRMNII